MLKISVVFVLMVFGLTGFAQVKMQKQAEGILFTEDGENVLFYQMKPKNADGKYERCNYIHPLWGIDGTVLTEDFPEDHLHQRGVYWAWHQIWIDGKRIGDGWAIDDFEQEVTDVEYISQESGTAVFKTTVEWKSDLWKNDGEKVPYLREESTFTIHTKTGNYRIIDFEISLTALEENLSIGGSEDEKGYSGFSVRMKLPDDVKFIGPKGIIEPQNEAVHSNGYVNISGSVGKNSSSGGIVMVDNPQNPGYPQSWILRNQKSMQNAAFPGNKPVVVSTREPLVLKYSLIVYAGNISNKNIKRILKYSALRLSG
ncbi:MAG TPA: PmoA family protein, partial [Draconibacterium sp.]|nr:PmoA family protein [Draconibacterium sp.]